MELNLNISASIDKKDIPTGMYPVIIYQVIRQYTNENNKITISDIKDTLMEYWGGKKEKESFQVNLNRTIKRNLESLLLFDTNIMAEHADGTPYFIDSGESIGKIHRIWYEQELSPTDVQVLSDAVVYSKHLSKESKKSILDKLMSAAGQPVTSKDMWFNSIIKNADDISVQVPGDLYKKLEYVNDAITNKNCIAFDYSFSGPNNKKYKVRTYTGISPYKILLNNGIYYMIAANKEKTEHYKAYLKHNKPYPLLYIEVHKLDKIHTDFNSEYLDIEKTYGNKKSIREYLSEGYHPLTHEISPHRFIDTLEFNTSSRGLDILLDYFGDRLKIKKLKEKDKRYVGPTPELAYRYNVILNNAALNDWYEILRLLLSYPIQDIELIKPLYLLQGVYHKMEHRLEKLQN